MLIFSITSKTPVTFSQLHTLMCDHDWFYSFSDSSSAWRAGESAETIIKMVAIRHPFSHYMFNQFIQRRSDTMRGTDKQDIRGIKDMYDDWSMTQEGTV
jgi:hypothetical protein